MLYFYTKAVLVVGLTASIVATISGRCSSLEKFTIEYEHIHENLVHKRTGIQREESRNKTKLSEETVCTRQRYPQKNYALWRGHCKSFFHSLPNTLTHLSLSYCNVMASQIKMLFDRGKEMYFIEHIYY